MTPREDARLDQAAIMVRDLLDRPAAAVQLSNTDIVATIDDPAMRKIALAVHLAALDEEDPGDLKAKAVAAGHDEADVLDRLARIAAMGVPRKREAAERLWATKYQAAPADDSSRSLKLMWGSEIERRAVEWFWEGRYAMGKVGILSAKQGTGKSTLVCDLAARVTRGDLWPDGAGRAPKGKVLFLSLEDDPEDTFAPRMDAAGADDNMWAMIVGTEAAGEDSIRPLNVAGDVDAIRGVLREHPDIRAVVIDPVTEFITAPKSASADGELRQQLNPLKVLAREFNILVLLIMHHRKEQSGNGGGGGDPIDVVLGQTGFTAVVRSAWALGKREGSEAIHFVNMKMNVGKPGPNWTIELVDSGAKDIAAVRWGDESSETKWSLFGRGASDGLGKTASAAEHVRGLLADGPMPSVQIHDATMEDLGVNKRTVGRAMTALGCPKEKVTSPSGESAWWRCLPEHEAQLKAIAEAARQEDTDGAEHPTPGVLTSCPLDFDTASRSQEVKKRSLGGVA